MMRWGWGLVTLVVALLGACSDDSDVDERCAFPGDAPMCGQQCTNPCGCSCRQPPGPHCSGDQILECVQGTWGPCYQPRAPCASGTCLEHKNTTPTHCAADCEELRQTYVDVLAEGHVAVVESGSPGLAPGAYNYSNFCSPDDCSTTTTGHCQLGLGGCWYLGKRIPMLDQLALGYETLGCSANTSCDCPAQMVSATCEGKSDGWEVPEGPWLKHYNRACVVK